MVKKKTSYLQRKQKDTGNKKAIIWVGSVLAVIFVLVTILIVFNS